MLRRAATRQGGGLPQAVALAGEAQGGPERLCGTGDHILEAAALSTWRAEGRPRGDGSGSRAPHGPRA